MTSISSLLRSLYHFLGSLSCALILIATTTLFVIAGTFVESATKSHQYAALLTYDTPLFAALLWGFFVNILFSATRRWPFRWKHVPFLITHCGLLMILGGVLVKHYYGLQGTMTVMEGAGSHEVIDAHTYALYVEQKGTKMPVRYPLQKTVIGHISPTTIKANNGLSIRLTQFCPHCKEHLSSWIKGEEVTIRGLKPMSLYQPLFDSQLPVAGRVRFHATAPVWDLYAFKTSEPERIFKALYLQRPLKSPSPFLAVMKEENGDIHFIACSPDGEVWSETFSEGHLSSLIAYDDGFAGYAAQVELPFGAASSQKETWQQVLKEELIAKLNQAVEERIDLSQPLLSLQEACARDQIDFPEAAANLLIPLLHPQHAAQLLGGDFALSLANTETPSLPLSFEATIVPVHEELPPGTKLEQNTPKITLFVREGKRSQLISLAYDRAGNGLKWPVLDGSYLMRFQPQFHEIPYHVRIRQARQINYPNSSQPYSFESDLLVTDRQSSFIVETTISMNHVYETWDGYRFYLSGMAPSDETAVKQVQIVVNYDPAKYFLTYPGAIVLSLGILLLFVLRPYRF